MSKIILKTDIDSLKILIKKECIEILRYLSDTQVDFSCEPPMSEEELNDYYNEILQDLEEKSNQKV